MKKIFFVLIVVTILFSCKSSISEVNHIIDKEFEIYKVSNSKATLVLFPCFPCDIENTKNEFPIIEEANKKGVSVILMNYNFKLYLKDSELQNLSKHFNSIFENNKLSTDNVYIGGFSGGGNVTLLLSNSLIKEENSIQPKGVFIVDSPIDLLGLYKVAEKNIISNFSSESVQEANWIIDKFNSEFGNPKDSISLYKKLSPYTLETNTISNVENLKNLKIRLYTEPDFDWWLKNRKNQKDEINSYFIEQLYNDLKIKGFQKIELINTKNKGYRADGTRHPHSWAIVDKENLLNWVLEKN
ncbi:hypothetical protein [Flavobacterium sp.]|jgi:hypothetical protein|uniref:hypothetical protein n=1 Tax=Flavobacterium sp. TaxID=239 RepID=UPI0035B397F7